MRILVDMDEVIYDLVGPWLYLYNRKHPDQPLTQEDLLSWDMAQYAKYNIYEHLSDHNVYVLGSIIPGAYEITKKWQDLGYEVGIVTSIVDTVACVPKLEWINRKMPHLKDHVHIITGKTKHWFDADILIDDAVHNLEHFKGKGILMDKPWNRQEVRFTRVRNWEQIDFAVLTYNIMYLKKEYNKSREIRLEY